MNKTAIRNFAIWARNKLIADITYKAGLLGVTEQEIKPALPQSTKDVQFFDIGTKEPYSISGIEIKQREKLAEIISSKAKQSNYKTAYQAVVEEVAYTWFNRLIAVRFMEVNDYLPFRIRVLSSESNSKIEPDLVTTPFDANLDYTPYEKDRIVQLTHENRMDELFQMLFIKQCNALNAILPNLFEKTSDYSELLLNVSFTDKDGVVYRLVHDIPEEDFKIRTDADEEAIRQGTLKEEDAPKGQVEIIGWLYQYYNTEPKGEAFALLKKNIKITKERIPAATQLFTPDWIVRYMVENSLGRLWIEREKASSGVSGKYLNGSYFGWKYYLEEAEQESDVEAQLAKIREEYKTIKPEDIKVIDPCMGSGHILVYAFDVLMQIYESCGYSQRDAAKSILVHNIYGLDIDNRAYQLAYFAIMMKARQYNRRILDGETDCHVYSIQESNGINREHLKYFGAGMSEIERNTAMLQLQGLLDTFTDAKEYGSILNVENYNWELLYRFSGNVNMSGQMALDTIGIEDTKEQLRTLVEIGAVMVQKYDVVMTNPPYMGISNGNGKLNDFVKKYYPDGKADLFAVFIEKCGQMTRGNGFLAMITMQSWMFLSSFEAIRKDILLSKTILSLIHVGYNSFPEINSKVAQAVAFVIRRGKVNYYSGKYLDLTNKYPQAFDKESAFLYEMCSGFYVAPTENFSKIPGYPIAYWVSRNYVNSFTKTKLRDFAEVITGMTTGDNNKYLRLWYEVNIKNVSFSTTSMNEVDIQKTYWFPYSKGGSRRNWYGNGEYLVNWSKKDEFNRSKTTLQHLYFKEGLTWPFVTSGIFSARYLKPGYLWDVAGSPCFFKDREIMFYTLGYLCSKLANNTLKIINPTINVQAVDLEKLPLLMDEEHKKTIIEIVKNNIFIAEQDWNTFELSWDFITHPLLTYKSGADYTDISVEKCVYKIAEAFSSWKSYADAQFNRLKSNEEELNRIFIDIYGLHDELTPEIDDKDVTICKADLERDIRSFVSYAVGCMFGRYSLDMDGLAYAGGEWDDSKYISFIPDKDNILPITDEEYFEDDIVGLLVAFVKKVYGADNLEQNLDFIASALGSKGNTAREIIRNYFVKDFFQDHCKIYQKRPIYWLFDSGKADGFKALIYLHRYDENTIGNMRIDYLHRMQRVFESEIARMQDTIDNSTNAREVTAAEKRKEKLIKQLKETKEYDEKIAHLALARKAIDLDDGIKVNYEKVQNDTDGKKLEVLAKI